MSKFLLSLLIVLLILNNVSSKGPRFTKLSKKYIGKSELNGKYNRSKYEDEPTTFKRSTEDKETKENIKSKINLHEVDNDGNEYSTEIDENEIDTIITRGLAYLTEGSNKDSLNDSTNTTEIKDKKKRRLMILGDDTRYEITSATYHPVNKIGLLTFGSGSYCTAALIGPKTILTAGHCVHEGNGGNWYNNFKFYPGKTSTYTPEYYSWSRAFTFQGWSINGDYDWDIALIELSSYPNKGWISMGYDTSINDDWYIYSKGYDGDKTYGSMWATSDYISDANDNTLETDDSDTYPGHSGAPWYAYPSYLTYSRIFAAHSGSGWWFGYYNRHTRITSTKFTAFCTWINDATLC